MYDSTLGQRVLAAYTMPETNGYLAVQAWNASDTLGRIVRKLKKLFRGKTRAWDLCEADTKDLAKKIDLLEQVRGEIVGALMYLRQALFDIENKREKPPSHRRPKPYLEAQGCQYCHSTAAQ